MSLTAKILRGLMILIQFKWILSKLMLNPQRWFHAWWPKWLPGDMDIQWRKVDGHQVATIAPAGSSPKKHIFYLHGGGYNMGFLPMFTKFAVNAARDNTCRVSLLDYPLAPEYKVEATRAMVIKTYRHMCEVFPEDEMVLCGDSAGGGLALVLADAIKQEGLRKPHSLVLISPWVNADMNRDFAPYEKMDVVLGRATLVKAMDNYRGDLSVEHPWLSPINGDLNHMGKVTIVAGSGEMFYPDIVAFKNQLEACEGNSVTWYEGEGLWHDWVYMALPEAKACREKLFN
jgi:monoterpene epsilon-lactone hydrolase